MILNYQKLIIETFLHYLLIPLSNDYLYSKILKYPDSRFGLLTLTMLIGFIAAQTVNYSIGIILKIYSKRKQKRNSFVMLLEKYSIPIVFCSAPFSYFGPIVMFLFGFINFRFSRLIVYSCLES